MIGWKVGDLPPTESPHDESHYEQLKFETARQKRKTKQRKQDSRSKAVRSKKAKKASKGKSGKKRQRSDPGEDDNERATPTAKLSPEIAIALADLTEDKADLDMDNSLSHLTPQYSLNPPALDQTPITGGSKRNSEETEEMEPDDDAIDSDVLGTDAMASEIYNEFDQDRPLNSSAMLGIDNHKWDGGQLKFRVEFDTEEKTWLDFRDLQEDRPRELAEYMVQHQVT